MDATAARTLLRVGVDADDDELRAAYRAALRRTHPDLHGGAGDAGDATRRVVAAYRLLASHPAAMPAPAAETAPAPATDAVVVHGDTVAAELPAGDLFAMLLEVGDQIGEVTYADAPAGLLEIAVELAGHGTCSVVLTLQGRGSGMTEAFCTVEPLGAGPPPPPEDVALLLAGGLRSLVQ